MNDLSKYGDMDYFFYHDDIELIDEIRADVVRGIIQPRNSLFYARNIDSAGVYDYENWPNSVFYEIGIRFAVIEFLSKRNLYVTDGSSGQKDRRAISSQNIISVDTKGAGEKDINILFIALANMQDPQSIQVPVGVDV